jgi:hypothetical protein
VKVVDRVGAMLRLLIFNDERGTVSERAEHVSAETREIGERVGAEVADAAYNMKRDPMSELLRTFPRRS